MTISISRNSLSTKRQGRSNSYARRKRTSVDWRRRSRSIAESERKKDWKDLEGWKLSLKKFINQAKREGKKLKGFTDSHKPQPNLNPKKNNPNKKTLKHQVNKQPTNKKQKLLSKPSLTQNSRQELHKFKPSSLQTDFAEADRSNSRPNSSESEATLLPTGGDITISQFRHIIVIPYIWTHSTLDIPTCIHTH